MKFRRQSKAGVDVNLTPLIDVVFLLLIFFMVSTSFVKETHLSLNLPKAEKSAISNPEKNDIEVVIDQNGFYRINSKMLVDTKSETISSALKNLSGQNYSRPLTIAADANAPYQAIVTIIDIGGQLGFSKINITTQDDKGNP